MAKTLYTANEIVNLVKEQHVTRLVLTKEDLITPLARDAARELGLQLIEGEDHLASEAPPTSAGLPGIPKNDAERDLETRVREIVSAVLQEPPAGSPAPVGPMRPVIRIDGRELSMPPFPFDIQRPEMDVRLEDVITHAHGSPMAAGFMSLHKGSFPWTLTYDEIEYVIEGELHIGTPQGTVIGKPGDVIFVPKGSKITFGTPGWAKFLYVTYPAEWAG